MTDVTLRALPSIDLTTGAQALVIDLTVPRPRESATALAAATPPLNLLRVTERAARGWRNPLVHLPVVAVAVLSGLTTAGSCAA